jgi:hypothetical protein
MPVSEGIVGNETAEQLAKTGSEHPFTGPEPACGTSNVVAKKAVRNRTKRNNKKPWNPQLDSNRKRHLYQGLIPEQRRIC